MTLTPEERHILYVASLARAQGLECACLLQDTQRAAKICNGIGAEWMPSWLRWMVTTLNPTLEAVAYIHDMEYSDGGTPGARLDADIRFLTNGFRAACFLKRWYSPRRYLVMAQAFKFFILLRLFGAAAFNFKGGHVHE